MSKTIIQEAVFWEPEFSHRGTLSIVISCLSTLGISLWSALHLSIPRRRRTWQQNLGVKLMWMVIGLFLPELLIALAVEQWQIARFVRDEVNSHFEPGIRARPWYNQWIPSRTHTNTVTSRDNGDEEQTLFEDPSDPSDAPFTCKLEAPDQDSDAVEPADDPADSDTSRKPLTKQGLYLPIHRAPASGRHRWTLTHGFYAFMGGFALYDDSGEPRILSHTAILRMLKDRPDLIPDISIETIHNASRADGLAKSLLVLQLGWFCISSIGRVAQHLPLTLLEVSTLTHALCAVVIYAIWWHKPLNIEEPLIIAEPGFLRNDQQYDRKGSAFDIENFDSGFLAPLVPLAIVPLVYGAPHLAAWNSYFATNTEQLLWRVSACAVTGTPLLFLPVFLPALAIYDALEILLGETIATLFTLGMVLIFLLLYLSANLFLIAESLRQLFHLPPAAFQTTKWAEFFPHI